MQAWCHWKPVEHVLGIMMIYDAAMMMMGSMTVERVGTIIL